MSKQSIRKAVVVYSGGLDSTTLLYKLIAEGTEVRCLGFNYGQRHRKELERAADICESLGVPYQVVDMSGLAALLPGSSQTDYSVEVPEGHYEEESMKKTVVPNRNMIMLAMAAAHAIAMDIEWIAYAAHAGDHAIYPDCRPSFVNAMERAFQQSDWKEVHLFAPYALIGLDKGDIVAEGIRLGVPYEKTWTCYKGLEKHCGKCGSCRERKDAFLKAGAVDPTEYME